MGHPDHRAESGILQTVLNGGDVVRLHPGELRHLGLGQPSPQTRLPKIGAEQSAQVLWCFPGSLAEPPAFARTGIHSSTSWYERRHIGFLRPRIVLASCSCRPAGCDKRSVIRPHCTQGSSTPPRPDSLIFSPSFRVDRSRNRSTRGKWAVRGSQTSCLHSTRVSDGDAGGRLAGLAGGQF